MAGAVQFETDPLLRDLDQRASGSRSNVFLLTCLCLTAFVVNTVSSLASPFYPSDACKFGVSESVIGLILGMYHLTVFIVAPVTPLLIGKLSVEVTLKLGILVAGISAILFGFLNLINSKIAFILVSVLLRCIQGCGCAFVDTSLYTIVSDRFSHNVGKVSGILTTSVGVGFMVGPPLGGFFYTLGGFFLPFVVMGSLTLIMWVLMVLVLPKSSPAATPKRRRLFSLYAYVEQDGLEQSIVGYTDSKEGSHWGSLAREIPFVPNVQLGDHISLKTLMDVKLLSILLTTMVGSSILGFQEPNLSIFLENAGFKEGAIGGLFLLRDFFFAVGSIGIGYLVDAVGPYSILGVGLALGSAGYCVLGPIPPFDPSLFSIIMGLAITGFAGSIPWVAGLPCLLKATRHHGNKKSLNSQLSGLQNSCLYFGIFVGSIMGGTFLDFLSYRDTYLYYSIIPVLTAIAFTLAMLLRRSRGTINLEESLKA